MHGNRNREGKGEMQLPVLEVWWKGYIMSVTINYCCHRVVRIGINYFWNDWMSKRGHAGFRVTNPTVVRTDVRFRQRLTGNVSKKGKVTQRRSLPLAFCCIQIKTDKEGSKEEFGKALTSSSLLPHLSEPHPARKFENPVDCNWQYLPITWSPLQGDA